MVVAFLGRLCHHAALGASIADSFGKDHAGTGLGLGDGPVSTLCLILLAALVA